ncbi:iron ABC transporter ATP-binding protein [Carboxydothermus islandicus]|uniref:Iron ABC transporter ATP-binding protein n=1 Tax=Carboxydothermus islandicus TaxID=661089 RepID=A0A1L8D2N4_9THEO|nr:ABC transporter ATP-binding protein [Carboxydothermus islandicus]GAV25456.1 iron ABC transporter ATP-binding protein [Carboxydothermus islandicus]
MLKGINLVYGYGNTTLFEGINIEVQPGKFTVILGPNGAGKTTLLKILAGFLKPREGTVEINDQEIFKLPAKKRARMLAYVPQEPETLRDYSVWDTVMMGRYPYQGFLGLETKKDFQGVKKAIETVGLAGYEERTLLSLSGGERQRVYLARALAQEADYILLDEPTNHLDLFYQVKILSLLKDLAAQGKGILAVLHDLNLASFFADRLYLFSEGDVITGAAGEVLTFENIYKAYKEPALVVNHPVLGIPQVLPLIINKSSGGKTRVHIIGGGGMASGIMLRESQQGAKISAGVLNKSDSDWQTAKALGAEVVEEEPFSPISQESYRRLLEVLKKADKIVVAPVPIGPGNLQNIEALLEVEPKKIFIVKPEEMEKRDYSGGRATYIVNSLIKAGAQKYPEA